MRIVEVTNKPQRMAKLTALAQFLSARIDDMDAEEGISVDAFLSLAHSIGIAISRNDLYELIKSPPLNNVVQEISNDIVIFTGQIVDPDKKLSVDQSRKIVDKMAKRASDL